MSGDMERIRESQVSYHLDNKEQEEFIQWFGRSFLRRKKDARLTGMNFQTYPRPDISNLKEDTKIQMGFRSLHIWSGQKELSLLYSALTDLEESGTLILFFAQKEFWAVPKRALGGEDEAGKWFGQLKAFCSRGIYDRTDFEAVRERCRRNGSRCFYYTRTVDQVLEAYMGLGRKEKELQNLRNLAVFPYRYAGVQALTLEPDGIYEYGERSVARHLYGDLKSAVYTRDILYLIKGDGEEIMLPVDRLDGMGEPGQERLKDQGEPGQERLENQGEPGPEPPLGISRFLAVCNGRRPPGLPGLDPVKLDTPKAQERSKRRLWMWSRQDPDRLIVMDPYRKHGKSVAGWFSRHGKRKGELSGRRWWKHQKKRNKQGQALAVRSEDSRWLGIDSPSLQQNCYEPNARKVSEIFQADVTLYDEFDGDLLMVAYCSKDQKHSCQRATSFHKDMLEQEFQCYGAEQKLPEELLQYMDLSMEEASAIWEDMDVVFQIEK